MKARYYVMIFAGASLFPFAVPGKKAVQPPRFDIRLYCGIPNSTENQVYINSLGEFYLHYTRYMKKVPPEKIPEGWSYLVTLTQPSELQAPLITVTGTHEGDERSVQKWEIREIPSHRMVDIARETAYNCIKHAVEFGKPQPDKPRETTRPIPAAAIKELQKSNVRIHVSPQRKGLKYRREYNNFLAEFGDTIFSPDVPHTLISGTWDISIRYIPATGTGHGFVQVAWQEIAVTRTHQQFFIEVESKDSFQNGKLFARHVLDHMIWISETQITPLFQEPYPSPPAPRNFAALSFFIYRIFKNSSM